MFAPILLAIFASLVPQVARADDRDVRFNDQIRPILSKHCIACHGPDEGDRQADLRLDNFDGATESAIVPGEADASDLIERIITDDVDLRMPPPDHAPSLTAEEVDLLRRWIDGGAQYERHWSFAPPRLAPVPSRESLPSDARVQNEIDSFIIDRFVDQGLSQNPAAEPAALIRRVSLDLTGLPPTAHSGEVRAAIDRYLSEPNPVHFGEVVDRLLNSPGYGEHWAAVWLDIARYADTVGYSGDETRDIWPWRDWLIRSLQANQSYRDMSIDMLAGDLLPDATDEQRLATAFHRNTLSNNEGGTNDEEFRVIAIKDRLSTTLNAWMGLTVRCAECHSHKYDPISQIEYYQLLDFFNQTADADHRDDRPKLEFKPEVDPAVTARLDAKIKSLRKKQSDQPPLWNELKPVKMSSRNGSEFELQSDNSILATGKNPKIEEYAFTFEVPEGTTLRAIRLEALPNIKYDGNVGRAPEGAFILSQIRLTRHEGENEIAMPFADAENDFNQVNQHAKTAIAETVESGGKKGWAVNHPVSGYKSRHEAIFELKEPLIAKSVTRFTVYLLHDPPWPRLNMGCVRISACDIENAALKYRKNELDPINREINDLIAESEAPVRVPIMEALPESGQREMFVMIRGNYQIHDERVSAKFPDAFPGHDDAADVDRLGLAKWLFEDDNPLTARVAVNRYWSRLMGIGLVETEEDFGTQGSPPSHPELLDFLAIQFRDGGWDVHELLKLIVMSASYQQSPATNQRAMQVDTRNRLLSRGPRIRLSAEVVRDQTLAVSGLLSSKVYGPPVYPPSPIKRVVNAFTGGMTWEESEGEDRYRRAIYTFLKRSSPHPLFETFDMSSREVCSMRRLRTNTPLQSFMTLNDVTFIEAARALADQMIASSAAGKYPDEEAMIADEIGFGLKQALYVPGDEQEIHTLQNLYLSSLSKYSSDIRLAAELVTDRQKTSDPTTLGDFERSRLARRASMTVVANVILNLDRFLNN